MKPTLVVDSSIAVAWCFADEKSEYTEGVLSEVVENSAVAPVVWPLETANALLMAERRKRTTRAQTDAALAFLQKLPIHVQEDSSAELRHGTIRLARKYDLTVYDATYLGLALRDTLPLATLDKPLAKAAKASGVELFSL